MTNRGTAYILYNHPSGSESAIAHMHEAQLDGVVIAVSIVLPRRAFSRSPPPARSGRQGPPAGRPGPPPRGPAANRYRSPRREEGVLVEADEGYKTIHMRHDPTTLAHRRHRGEDGDRARSRDHRREGLHQDEAQQEGAQEEEARQQGDEEAQATVLEVVTAGAGVAHGVNPELGVDMAAGDEIAIK